MKKIIAGLLLFLLVLSVTSCTAKNENVEENDNGVSQNENENTGAEENGNGDSQKESENTGVEETDLRFDGLYYCVYYEEDGVTVDYNKVLRFYESNDVISMSVATPNEAGEFFPDTDWFDKATKDTFISKGNYTASADRIEFETLSSGNSVEYNGIIEKDKLILSSYAALNGNETHDQEYIFISFDKIG